MTAFDIDGNGYLQLNEQLLMHVNTVGQIIQDLNGVLKHIVEAVDNSATPLWIDAQTSWNAAYTRMSQQLNTSTLSSINVADIFNQGDRQGARIMLT